MCIQYVHAVDMYECDLFFMIPSNTCSFTIKGNPWLPISVAQQ